MQYKIKSKYKIPNKPDVIDQYVEDIVDLIGDCNISGCYDFSGSDIQITVNWESESESDALEEVRHAIDAAMPEAIFREIECLSVIFDQPEYL